MAEDHPRTCGEKLNIWTQKELIEGSPPHMRGKVETKNFLKEVFRITPAHAGKSGENVLPFNQILGSPPHMRGKVRTFSLPFFTYRITPAHAGKSKRFT